MGNVFLFLKCVFVFEGEHYYFSIDKCCVCVSLSDRMILVEYLPFFCNLFKHITFHISIGKVCVVLVHNCTNCMDLVQLQYMTYLVILELLLPSSDCWAPLG